MGNSDIFQRNGPMEEVGRTKKALMTVGGVIVINLLLAILASFIIITLLADMITASCLLGSIAILLTALHPLFVIFAGVSILQARSEKISNDISGILAAVLMFLSMFFIVVTMGYGALLSPPILFAAMGIYMHSLLETRYRPLLYTGIGLLLLFYFFVFIIFMISDMANEVVIQSAILTISILPLSTCTLYLLSLYHSFNGLSERPTPKISPIVLRFPLKQPQQERPSILLPPPGWMADEQPLPMCRLDVKPQKPPGWNPS